LTDLTTQLIRTVSLLTGNISGKFFGTQKNYYTANFMLLYFQKTALKALELAL
jgi:hypothetical protein